MAGSQVVVNNRSTGWIAGTLVVPTIINMALFRLLVFCTILGCAQAPPTAGRLARGAPGRAAL